MGIRGVVRTVNQAPGLDRYSSEVLILLFIVHCTVDQQNIGHIIILIIVTIISACSLRLFEKNPTYGYNCPTHRPFNVNKLITKTKFVKLENVKI